MSVLNNLVNWDSLCRRFRCSMTGQFVAAVEKEEAVPQVTVSRFSIGRAKPVIPKGLTRYERQIFRFNMGPKANAFFNRYEPLAVPHNPEDDMIAHIDGDIEDNNELDAYVSYDMSLAELEEWVEFEQSWEENERVQTVVKIMVKKDEGHVTYRVPADTVLPDDKPMLEELEKELEKPIKLRSEKHGGPQTWNSKKEHRSFKLKETHKGHQPRGPVRVLASDYIAKIREAWLKKQQRRNNKKGN